MLTKQDYTIGAIWKLARKRGMSKAVAIDLLVERAKMTAAKAEQLASHWRLA